MEEKARGKRVFGFEEKMVGGGKKDEEGTFNVVYAHVWFGVFRFGGCRSFVSSVSRPVSSLP